MKKTYLSLIAFFATLQFSYGQWTNATNIYNTNTGNVGIGTSSPGHKLDIAGTLRLYTGNAVYFDNASGSNIFQHSTGSFSMNASTAAGGNGNIVLNSAAGSGIYLNFSSGSNTFFGNGASGTTGVIQSGGNAGFGTTTPDVFSRGYSGRILGINATGQSAFEINGSGSVIDMGVNGTRQVTMESQAGFNGLMTHGNSPLYLGTSDVVRMWINGSGDIGIGTTDPQGYKLAVNGGIHSKSVKVDLTGWPDFVFENDYKLPTLTEVKTYIDKNRHLPDMPSADEVHGNGLDLGEMNRLLLKKVEELTLYLIEKDSQVKQLQNKVNKLEKNQADDRQKEARIETLEAVLLKLSAKN